MIDLYVLQYGVHLKGVFIVTQLGYEVIKGESQNSERVPVLGMYQPQSPEGSGRLSLYGDSNCLDNSHLQKGNAWIQVKKFIMAKWNSSLAVCPLIGHLCAKSSMYLS